MIDDDEEKHHIDPYLLTAEQGKQVVTVRCPYCGKNHGVFPVRLELPEPPPGKRIPPYLLDAAGKTYCPRCGKDHWVHS